MYAFRLLLTHAVALSFLALGLRTSCIRTPAIAFTSPCSIGVSCRSPQSYHIARIVCIPQLASTRLSFCARTLLLAVVRIPSSHYAHALTCITSQIQSSRRTHLHTTLETPPVSTRLPRVCHCSPVFAASLTARFQSQYHVHHVQRFSTTAAVTAHRSIAPPCVASHYTTWLHTTQSHHRLLTAGNTKPSATRS